MSTDFTNDGASQDLIEELRAENERMASIVRGRAETPVDYANLLQMARQRLCQLEHWRKAIGTPLENDIPVVVVEFALDVSRIDNARLAERNRALEVMRADELDVGKRLATELAAHLIAMRAGSAMIPVWIADKRYEVNVRVVPVIPAPEAGGEEKKG